MKIYVINSDNEKYRLELLIALADKLKDIGSVLIFQSVRTNENLEEKLSKDGIITYDIADYFLEEASLDRVIINQEKNLDFAIAPYLKNKIEIKKSDIERLLKDIDYDYLIIDSLDLSLIDEKESIYIIDQNNIPESIAEDCFYIENVKDGFDDRYYKDSIEKLGKNYLGYKKREESLDKIVDTIINKTYKKIDKLSFFEKMKLKFKKWVNIYL